MERRGIDLAHHVSHDIRPFVHADPDRDAEIARAEEEARVVGDFDAAVYAVETRAIRERDAARCCLDAVARAFFGVPVKWPVGEDSSFSCMDRGGMVGDLVGSEGRVGKAVLRGESRGGGGQGYGRRRAFSTARVVRPSEKEVGRKRPGAGVPLRSARWHNISMTARPIAAIG